LAYPALSMVAAASAASVILLMIIPPVDGRDVNPAGGENATWGAEIIRPPGRPAATLDRCRRPDHSPLKPTASPPAIPSPARRIGTDHDHSLVEGRRNRAMLAALGDSMQHADGGNRRSRLLSIGR
jgi:hypothetical protein